MKLALTLLSVVLFVFGIEVRISNAQPLARFSYPSDGATKVSLSPSIKLVHTLPVDSSSVIWVKPDDDLLDSVGRQVAMTIAVIPKIFHDSLPKSQWWQYAEKGTGGYLNDSTLEFTPNGLALKGDYVAVVEHLNVISSGDTVAVPDSSIAVSFTTILPPFRPINNSLLNSGYVTNCNSAISVQLDQPLDSAGSILQIVRRTITPVTDSLLDSATVSQHVEDTLITTSAWLDSGDPRTIVIQPSSNFDASKLYVLKLNLSNLTGDTDDDRFYPIKVRAAFKLNMGLAGPSPLDTLPSGFQGYPPSGVTFVKAGDTIPLWAPTTIPGYTFDHWLGDPELDTMTSPSTFLTQNCGGLEDKTIRAIYKKLPVDTLTMVSASCGDIEIIVDGTTSYTSGCVAAANVKVPVTRGKIVEIKSHPAGGYKFTGWTSTDTELNGNLHPIVRLAVNGNASLSGTQVPSVPLGVYQICGVIMVDGHPKDPVGSIGYLSACQNSGTSGTSGTVTLHISDPCWGVSGYAITTHDPSNPTTTITMLPSTEDEYPLYAKSVTAVETNDDQTTVTFFVKKLTHRITIDIVMQDGSEPKDVKLVPCSVSLPTSDPMYIQLCPDSPQPDVTLVSGPTAGSATYSYTFDFQCQPPVTIKSGAKTADGYQFIGYTPGSGNISATGSEIDISAYDRTYDGKHVHAVFNSSFRLVKIGLYQDHAKHFGTPDYQEYDVDTWLGGNDPVQRDLTLEETAGSSTTVPQEATTIILKFNRDVDVSSINNFDLAGYDVSARLDQTSPKWYAFFSNTVDVLDSKTLALHFNRFDRAAYSSGTGIGMGGGLTGGIVGESCCGCSSMTPALSPYWLEKLQEFDLWMDSRIKSTTGQPLANPGSYEMETVGPDVLWKLCSTYTDNDEDPDAPFIDDAGDVYVVWSGYYQSKANIQTPFQGRIPESGVVEINDQNTHKYDETLFGTTGIRRVGRDESVGLMMAFWDQDGCNFCASVGTFFTDVGTFIGTVDLSSLTGGTSSQSSIYVSIAQFAFQELGKLMSGNDNADDPLGAYSALATSYDIFGTSPSWRARNWTQQNLDTKIGISINLR